MKTKSEKSAAEVAEIASQIEVVGGKAIGASTETPSVPIASITEAASTPSPIAQGEIPLVAETPYGYKYTDKLGRPPSSLNPNSPACMAKRRYDGLACTKAAMVNKAGEYTRCREHGGASPGAPMKSGQYSKLAARRILEIAEDMENDAGLTAIENNVKILAALFVEKMESLAEEGLDVLPDSELGKLIGMTERLSNVIERRHRIREGQKYTVKIEHLQYIVVAVSDAVNRVLSEEPELRSRLAKEIEGIRVIEG